MQIALLAELKLRPVVRLKLRFVQYLHLAVQLMHRSEQYLLLVVLFVLFDLLPMQKLLLLLQILLLKLLMQLMFVQS